MTTHARLDVAEAGGAQVARLVVTHPERSRTMWNSMRKSLHDLDREHLLELVGLEARRSTAERLVPVFTVFGVGMLLGVGVGLMVAPKPGRELRHDLRGRLEKIPRPTVMMQASEKDGQRPHA